MEAYGLVANNNHSTADKPVQQAWTYYQRPVSGLSAFPGEDGNMRVDLSTIPVPFRDRLQINPARHSAAKTALVIELTFPLRGGSAGWSTIIYPVEVDCSGISRTSIPRILLSLGVTGPNAPQSNKRPRTRRREGL